MTNRPCYLLSLVCRSTNGSNNHWTALLVPACVCSSLAHSRHLPANSANVVNQCLEFGSLAVTLKICSHSCLFPQSTPTSVRPIRVRMGARVCPVFKATSASARQTSLVATVKPTVSFLGFLFWFVCLFVCFSSDQATSQLFLRYVLSHGCDGSFA